MGFLKAHGTRTTSRWSEKANYLEKQNVVAFLCEIISSMMPKLVEIRLECASTPHSRILKQISL